jgi:HEAT repeat protein
MNRIKMNRRNRWTLMAMILPLALSPVCTGAQEPGAIRKSGELENLREEREKIIHFGIDSQIIELLTQLEKEKNGNFNNELKKLFKDTQNRKLQAAIADLFDLLDDDSLVEAAHTLLKEYDDLDAQTAEKLIDYLEDRQDTEVSETFFEMRDAADTAVASRAVRALGESGETEYGEKLLELLLEDRLREELQPAVLLALGKLKVEGAVDYLGEIVSDEGETASLRWRACEALGDLGGDRAFELLQSLLNDEDAYLRAYAVHALGGFDRKESVEALMDALRDSFWRVRVNAAEALGKIKAREALDILEYKALEDPDIENVRLAAVRGIGEIGSGKAYDILRAIYTDSTAPAHLRAESLRVLVEKDLGASKKSIETVMDREWDLEKSYILDYTCKQLSLKEDESLAPFYERMLGHKKNINIILYGLRGIRLNRIVSLKGKLEEMTGEDYPGNIRQLAAAVLEEL